MAVPSRFEFTIIRKNTQISYLRIKVINAYTCVREKGKGEGIGGKRGRGEERRGERERERERHDGACEMFRLSKLANR